jgi:hypothetical protein
MVDPAVSPEAEFAGSVFLKSHYAHYVVYGTSVFALLWAADNVRRINKVNMTADKVKIQKLSAAEEEEFKRDGKELPPQTPEECLSTMIKVSDLVKSGAIEFLCKEYQYLSIFCLFFGALIYGTVDYPHGAAPWTAGAFFIGALVSMLCGYVGMRIAVHSNVRTAWSCCDSIDAGFHVAFKGGQVLGFALVGLGLLFL